MTSAFRFHVLIPARLASTRLPNKPMADIGGQPMIVRVAQQAALSSALSVVVAGDDPIILEACQRANIKCVLTRVDHESGTDRLAQAAEILELSDDAVVVNVQGDEPFIEPELINSVASLLETDKDASMSTAAHAISSAADLANHNIVKVVTDAQANALYFSRACIPHARDVAAQNPLPVLRHMGIYAYRVEFLKRFRSLPPAPIERMEMLEQLRALWHGYRIKVTVAAHASPPGVDTREDLAFAQALWSQRQLAQSKAK
jgi:3-deoxy-manno-octulosonate cytidylyltransferase (CMP-KDO synthetase)